MSFKEMTICMASLGMLTVSFRLVIKVMRMLSMGMIFTETELEQRAEVKKGETFQQEVFQTFGKSH